VKKRGGKRASALRGASANIGGEGQHTDEGKGEGERGILSLPKTLPNLLERRAKGAL